MVKFNKEEFELLLSRRDFIRNLSIIAHVDHGKSTLTDQLASAAGFIDEDSAGEKRVLDVDKNEIEKGITIKSTSLSMVLNDPSNEKEKIIVNLIDSPGHIDFNSEVTAALRVTDGAILVVDSVEGCRGQTETVMRQALQEKIKPVLVINKVDRVIEELQFSPEEAYQNFQRIIESVNVLISTYGVEDDLYKNLQMDPTIGNVAFGSGKMGWAFTIPQFAELYSKKFQTSADKIARKLWGEHYYDHEAKKWSTEPYSKVSGKKLKPSFCEFILEPIFQIFKLVKERSTNSNSSGEEIALSEELSNVIQKLSISLSKEDRKKDSKNLLRTIMRKFLPASKSLIQMIIQHLPSPVQAQKYRYSLLYTGDLNDSNAMAIRDCDPNGPLILYVSKMIPMHSNTSASSISNNVGRFIAFCRVFSGTVKQSSSVRILGPAYEGAQSKKDVFNAHVQRVLIMLGKNTESVSEVSCGSTCGLAGLDKYIVKTCTCVDEDNFECMPIRNMKYSVSPVVQMGVEPVNPADMPKFVDAIKKLVKSDPLLECRTNSAGQYVLAAAGELHLEICMKNLEEEYGKGIPIKQSQPVVSFLETVTTECEPCFAKSPNKHNKLWIHAEPMSEELISLIEEGDFVKQDVNKRAKVLEQEFNWDPAITKKIWSFGPNDKGPNMLVNASHSVEYMNEIQDFVVTTFQQNTMRGALCDEPLRGVVFKVDDADLHSDSSHRNAGQVGEASRRAMCAAQLRASPKLVEPIYLVEIQCPNSVMGAIYSVVNHRRGSIKSTEVINGTPLLNIVCHLPVLESFGLTQELHGLTSGQAQAQCNFSHWSIMKDDVHDPSSEVNKLIQSIRRRKGLKDQIPSYTDYCDSQR
ncbi:hypothetical protein C9374_014705 [Naegleria lovaniensis]|uniref:Elongation factor 2 n=1 Tax=Naegleria lovaniensis TaxID=51637 RepID=A0AA88KGY7_NAELO|nr:uncharacterized protein C9374_014705 [Naegleria lovaniensis]KAG2370663.1 hypothetical protein C9374_014705 [Naegleria lovaniensis]